MKPDPSKDYAELQRSRAEAIGAGNLPRQGEDDDVRDVYVNYD